MRPIFASRPILVLLILAGLIQVATSAVIPILPLHVQAISHDSARVGTVTGMIIGVGALASALSAALMGRLSGRFGYGKALFAGLAVTAILHVPQAFAGTPLLLLLFRTIGSFTIGLTLPVINALIATRVERSSQGSVYGLSSSVVAIGSGIGPMAGAFAAVTMGFSSVFFLAALVLAGAAYLTKKSYLSGDREGMNAGVAAAEQMGK
jgi:MFS family permease